MKLELSKLGHIVLLDIESLTHVVKKGWRRADGRIVRLFNAIS